MGDAPASRPPPPKALSLTSLPRAVQHHVWMRLPVDARLRCREVCTAWRDALDDVTLWQELDLSYASGVAHDALRAMPRTEEDTPLRWDAGTVAHHEQAERRSRLNLLLSAAAARARGTLCCVDVSECLNYGGYCVSLPLLRDVLGASAATLRTLRILGGSPEDGRLPRVQALDSNEGLALLRAAPRLTRFDADVTCDDARNACEMLRCEGAWAPLRVRTLVFYAPDGAALDAMEALGAAAQAHSSLEAIEFLGSPQHEPPVRSALAPLLNALATPLLGDSARAPLRLLFRFCAFPDGVLRALALLMRNGRVADLTIIAPEPDDAPFAPLPDGGAALCDALRDCTALTSLELSGCRVVLPDVLPALTGHAALQRLRLAGSVGAVADAGAVLGALLGANAPALTHLVVHEELQDDALAPLCDALRRNTCLRHLSLSEKHLSAQCAADVLAPAALACMSLQTLESAHARFHLVGMSQDVATRERMAHVRRIFKDVSAALAARANGCGAAAVAI